MIPAADCTVFVVDDDFDYRDSLSRLLRSHGYRVRAYASAQEFLADFDPDAAGCVVLDFAMPGMDGLELQRSLHSERHSEIPILFLSGHAEIPDSVTALKEGAVDFLVKPVDPRVLLGAIELAFERDCRERAERVVRRELWRRFETLTPREREILAHVVTGQLNKQIARDLGCAEKTIRIHRGSVMRKLQADSVATLVKMAEKLGI